MDSVRANFPKDLRPCQFQRMANPFRYFNSSPEIIRLVVMMYVRYPLSLRNVEDLFVTGRLGVRLLEFCRTRAFWLETVARRNLKLAVNLRLADHDCVKRVLDFCETLACPRQRVIV